MTDYIPTTEEILRGFVAPTYRTHPRQDGESFSSYLGRISIESMWSQQQSEAAARRWLAHHDARIASEAAERALREAAEYLTVKTVDPAYEGMSHDGEFGSGFYQGIRGTRRALRHRADSLRAEREDAGKGES